MNANGGIMVAKKIQQQGYTERRSDMDDKIKELKKIIDESNNIVFFGGAGVSTESGIPDFRSANGIYNQDLGRTVSPEEMISHSFYMRHTEDFYEFYKDKLIYENAQPNNCHKALAELERQGKVKGHTEHRRSASEGGQQGGVGAPRIDAAQLLREMPRILWP